jgi:hypothetical protein
VHGAIITGNLKRREVLFQILSENVVKFSGRRFAEDERRSAKRTAAFMQRHKRRLSIDRARRVCEGKDAVGEARWPCP